MAEGEIKVKREPTPAKLAAAATNLAKARIAKAEKKAAADEAKKEALAAELFARIEAKRKTLPKKEESEEEEESGDEEPEPEPEPKPKKKRAAPKKKATRKPKRWNLFPSVHGSQLRRKLLSRRRCRLPTSNALCKSVWRPLGKRSLRLQKSEPLSLTARPGSKCKPWDEHVRPLEPRSAIFYVGAGKSPAKYVLQRPLQS